MITSVDDDLQPSNDVEARRKEKKKRKNKDKDREESGFSITAGHGGREPEAVSISFIASIQHSDTVSVSEHPCSLLTW